MQVVDENITNNHQSQLTLPTKNLPLDSSDKKIDFNLVIENKNDHLETEIDNKIEQIDKKEDNKISGNTTNQPLIEVSSKVKKISQNKLFDRMIQKNALKAARIREELTILNLTFVNTKEKIQSFFEEKYSILKETHQELSETVKKETSTFNDRQEQLQELFERHEHVPFDSQMKNKFSKVIKIDISEIEKQEKEMIQKQCDYDKIKTLNAVGWKALSWRLKECQNLLNQSGYHLGLKSCSIFGVYTDNTINVRETQKNHPEESELENSLYALMHMIISLREKVKIEADACGGYSRPQHEYIDNVYKTSYQKYLQINNKYIDSKDKIVQKIKELDKQYEDHASDKIPKNDNLEKELEKFSKARKEADMTRQHLKALSSRLDQRMHSLHETLNWLRVIIDNKYIVPLSTLFTTPIQPLPGKQIEEKEKK